MVLNFIVNILLIAICVLIHFEVLRLLTIYSPIVKIKPRFKVLLGVIGVLLTHIVEIWVYGFAFYLLTHFLDSGKLLGAFDGSLLDCVYFSFSCYTSLGFGDIVPVGLLRFTAVIETLTGLVLISWTASFMFIEMQSFWVSNVPHHQRKDFDS